MGPHAVPPALTRAGRDRVTACRCREVSPPPREARSASSAWRRGLQRVRTPPSRPGRLLLRCSRLSRPSRGAASAGRRGWDLVGFSGPSPCTSLALAKGRGAGVGRGPGLGRRATAAGPCSRCPSSLRPRQQAREVPHSPCRGAPRGLQTRFLSRPEARTSCRRELLAQLFAPLPGPLQRLLTRRGLWVG